MFLNVTYQWQAPYLYVLLLINLKFGHWPLYVWQFQNMCFYFINFYLFVCTLWLFYLFCSDKSRATFLAALFKMSPCADLGFLTKGGHLSFKWYLAVPHCPMLLGIVTLHLQMILYIFKWYLPVPNCHRVLQQKTSFCLRLDYKGIVLVSKENIF